VLFFGKQQQSGNFSINKDFQQISGLFALMHFYILPAPASRMQEIR
jgi:hypothetical protein